MLSDAVEDSAARVLSLHRATKFIIGFDFAVTLSSPEPFWVHKTQKMIPFITCEFSLGQHVCELVFGVTVFDLDVGVQIDSIEQPIKSNSVGSGNIFPLMIILITASLSTNTYNKAS